MVGRDIFKKRTGGQAMKKKKMRLPVIVTCNEEGYFFAEVPVIRGYAEGNTREEALVNITEVIHLCLVRAAEECDTIPVEYTMEQVDVTI
jgi:predicted RNase H-like HicB family nuclease